MASWIGCIGPDTGRALEGIKTEQRVLGANFALGICGGGGESASLRTDPTGGAQAEIGDRAEAGCSAVIAPNGPTITLSCDPFGLHGVFTAQVGNTFWFASDLHLLRQTAYIPAVLCPEALHGYLCFSYVPTPATLYTGIDALPAGSTLTTAPLSFE